MTNRINIMIKNTKTYSLSSIIRFISNEQRLCYNLKITCFKLIVLNYLS